MDLTHRTTRAALIINLGRCTIPAEQQARLQHMIGVLHGLGLPATLVLENVAQAEQILEQVTGSPPPEVVLSLEAQVTGRNADHCNFRRIVQQELLAIRRSPWGMPRLVMGDPEVLRSRLAFLSEQGVGGILSTKQSRRGRQAIRPLPCGLWQLEPTIKVAPARPLFDLLFPRRLSVKQVAAVRTVHFLYVDAEVLQRMSARRFRGVEEFLRDLSVAQSQNQLTVCCASETVASLACPREAKPQRSILRVAA